MILKDYLSNNRRFWVLEAGLALLAALSVVVIVSPEFWFSRTLVFYAQDYQINITNDSPSGGNSVVAWKGDKNEFWHCIKGNKFPVYCGSSAYVAKDGKGFDLSFATKMRVWIDYLGEDKDQNKAIKLYLRNANKKYITSENNSSTKYNQIMLPVHELGDAHTLDMELFSVADWWLSRKPPEFAQPEFDNITVIELQTGQKIEDNDYFRLRKIEWLGQAYSEETTFRALAVSWAVLILLLLMYRLISLKIRLLRDNKLQAELFEVNDLLKLKNLEFSELARTDHLTGLLNRMGLRDALHEKVKEWRVNNAPFSLILLDIDKFKDLNDCFGHDEGDKVLKALANFLSESVRAGDDLARWGGEEFIIVCHNTELERAYLVAENLRRKLQATKLHSKAQVTASFGVSSAVQSNVDDMFKRADRALYEAKKQGRNKVCKL